MKKFITNIIYFGILLLIINFIFYAITYKAYFKGYQKIDLTFQSYLLADSHGTPLKDHLEEYGIYNFAAASDSYIDMLRKVKYLIRHTEVNRIIMTVDDHTLSPYRENINNRARSSFYIIKEDYASPFTGIANSLKKHLVLLNPGIRHIIRSFVQSKIVKSTPSKQWALLSDKERKSASIGRYRFQFNFAYGSDPLKSALDEIIQLCHDNNIELIGIQYPLTKIYKDTIKDSSFYADRYFMSHHLKVLDYRRLYQDDDDYFSNQDHLNPEGSQAFVKVLTHDLQLKLN